MSVTHATSVRNAVVETINDHINSGGGTAYVRFRDGANTIVDIELPNPAIDTPDNGIGEFLGIPKSALAEDYGNIDNFQILNRAGTPIIFGSVTATLGGGDIEINNINVNEAQEVAIISLTYEAPA